MQWKTSNTNINMDKSQNHYAEWKPGTKYNIHNGPNYIKF